MKRVIFDTPGFYQYQITEGGEYQLELTAEGVELDIRGGFETDNSEDVSVKLTIIHAVRQTRSQTLLRGVARGKSHITLSGTIVIKENAQNTNAFLTENILLLSPQARAEAVPNLEISANDVRCSHAATITKIPEEHLFYLQSRGLPLPEAERLIVEGFLGQVKAKSLPI